MAHLVLPDTQADPSQNQKSHFFPLHHSMTRKLTTYLNKKYKKMALLTQCLLLLLKNLLLIRTLKLKNVSLYDRVVIQHNEIEMLWNVKGCHKIKINGIGDFPGNTHGLKFLFSNRHNPIEITFFGIARKLKKRILIENEKVDLLDKFIASTEIPVAFEVSCIRKKIENKITSENLIIVHPDIKVELNNVFFQFEPFNIEKYYRVKTS